MSIDRARLESACVHLKVDVFSDEEYEFLVEYHKVISLVANALKSLEADRYTFGLYLPTLIGLKLKLKALFDGNTMFHCLPLVIALQNGLESRFGELMDPFNAEGKSVPLYVAMLSNPAFKLNFLGMKSVPSNLLLRLKEMLYNAAITIENECSNKDVSDKTTADIHAHAHGNDKPFLLQYFFLAKCNPKKIVNIFVHLLIGINFDSDSLLIENVVSLNDSVDDKSRIMNEIDSYLRAKTNLSTEDGLKDFPVMRKIFQKYNCIRTSEAICERLFSYCGI